MTVKNLVPLAIASSLAVSVSIQAQEVGEIEEAIVWGTQVQSDSLFLGESDIAIKQADHLSDLLRSIPGVDIGGTHSVNSRINVRGLDDRDLGVYIDGVSQTNYLYHHLGNVLINPDILKSADIELGANSVLHGGLGGTVQFETKDALDLLADGQSFGGRVNVGVQSNAQKSVSATAFGQSQGFDFLAYVNSTDRDNFEDGSGQETVGSDGKTTNAMLKAGYQIAANQRIELSYDTYRDRGDYGQRPDMGYLAADGLSGDLDIPLFETEYDRDTVNLGYELDLSATRVEANLYLNSMRLYRDESDGIVHPFGFLIASTEKEVTADNSGAYVLASTELSRQQLRYGLEYFDQSIEYDSDVTISTDALQLQEAQSLALFIEDEISVTDAFTVTPGVRFNDYSIQNDSTGMDDSWDELTAALQLNYRVTDSLDLHASYTELFKGPELAEPFQGTGLVLVSNPDLQPETGDNVELGFRYSLELANGHALKLGANLFETTIDNYITEESLTDGSGNTWYVNSGTAVIDGFEASVNYALPAADVVLSYAKSDLDGADLEVDDTTESLRELGDSINLDVSFELGSQISAVYNVLHVRDADRYFGGDPKQGYTVHNVSLTYVPDAMKNLSIGVAVDNLFDEAYTSHASREGEVTFVEGNPIYLNDVEPGRNLKLSLSYLF